MKKNIEKLVQELNEILNQLIRENQDLKEILHDIHEQGFSVQISFQMEGEGNPGAVAHTDKAKSNKVHLKLSKEDYLFLKSIKISVDD